MPGSLRLKALIFDVDGTLAYTERDGHLPACNEAFAALGFPIRWTWEEFKALLAIPGNAQRMRLALQRLNPPLSPEEVEAAVARLVALKKQLYIEKYAPRLPLRPGVARIVEEAVRRGVRLAIVSTSDEDQVRALLQYRLPVFADRFEPILGKQAGLKTAPDSPLYRRCLAELGTTPDTTLAIEDSEVGLRAARAAGLPCAVIYNDYTFGQDFRGAVLVARSLEYLDLETLSALCLGGPDAPDRG
jgi:HAD superfamily hydrolase (TIGR01509 family)